MAHRTGDMAGNRTAREKLAPILADEVYTEYMRRVEQAASRVVQASLTLKKHRHNFPAGDDLSAVLKEAIVHCRSTLGYQQAVERRQTAAGHSEYEATGRDVGLATLACQILLADSKELRRKRKTDPRSINFSLERSWRSIPAQLRHIILPFHMLIRATSILRRAPTAQQRGNLIGELMLDAMSAHFFQDDDPSFAFKMTTTIWINASLQSDVEVPSLGDMVDKNSSNPRRVDLVVLSLAHRCDIILAALSDHIKRSDTISGLDLCLSLTIVLKNSKRFPMLWVWESVTPILMAALDAYERIESESRVSSDGSSTGAITRNIDQSLVTIAEACEEDMLKTGNYGVKSGQWRDHSSEDEDKLMFLAMEPVFRRINDSCLHYKLPLTIKCAVRWLVGSLNFFRIQPFPDPQSDTTLSPLHSCYFVMTSDPRWRRCKTYGESTDPNGMNLRCALEKVSDKEPGTDCRVASELIRTLTQKLPYGENSSKSQSTVPVVADFLGVKKSQRLFKLEDLKKPPFYDSTRLIMRCIAALSEQGLHRVEAELAATLLEAWNHHTEYFQHSGRYVNHEDEYDCEAPEHRRKRRALVADMIAERVARAEAGAIAQETKLRNEGQKKTRRTTKEDTPNRWRYEPLLDQWVDTAGQPTERNEDQRAVARSAETPRPSSPDPLIQTSPFAAKREHADNDQDAASDTDSIPSKLKRKSSSSNPYAKEIESSRQEGAAMPESEQDEMDLFQRRTPAAKRQRRAPQRYTSQDWDKSTQGKGKSRQI
ncbi:hypothetical protein OC846_003065 [Tilletia horrida]|uniref:Uncharacterized protein n=1 Tax=Tilletia horrida TaxID=155126 RepID=A0AAN6GPP6_9BASI|nr:hypothetical protein OC845_002820 [Tilletia horrida]KAK0551981.1 hypothetical protein OC846_003065 [Tilletia horrida]KAK0566174.1 hypothetical protein OC861_003395 [Tilletia horrida]